MYSPPKHVLLLVMCTCGHSLGWGGALPTVWSLRLMLTLKGNENISHIIQCVQGTAETLTVLRKWFERPGNGDWVELRGAYPLKVWTSFGIRGGSPQAFLSACPESPIGRGCGLKVVSSQASNWSQTVKFNTECLPFKPDFLISAHAAFLHSNNLVHFSSGSTDTFHCSVGLLNVQATTIQIHYLWYFH